MKKKEGFPGFADGGPAFPQAIAVATGEKPCTSYDFVDGAGMSLRDWFAGQAMSGFLGSTFYSSESANHLAEWSYQQADAMLKAREGK